MWVCKLFYLVILAHTIESILFSHFFLYLLTWLLAFFYMLCIHMCMVRACMRAYVGFFLSRLFKLSTRWRFIYFAFLHFNKTTADTHTFNILAHLFWLDENLPNLNFLFSSMHVCLSLLLCYGPYRYTTYLFHFQHIFKELCFCFVCANVCARERVWVFIAAQALKLFAVAVIVCHPSCASFSHVFFCKKNFGFDFGFSFFFFIIRPT